LLDQLCGGRATSEQSIMVESEVCHRDIWAVLLLTSASIYDLWIHAWDNISFRNIFVNWRCDVMWYVRMLHVLKELAASIFKVNEIKLFLCLMS
jgi:hypothetical protein